MERRLAEHSRRLKNLLRICPITVILVGHHWGIIRGLIRIIVLSITPLLKNCRNKWWVRWKMISLGILIHHLSLSKEESYNKRCLAIYLYLKVISVLIMKFLVRLKSLSWLQRREKRIKILNIFDRSLLCRVVRERFSVHGGNIKHIK
jgi:hypothetical protein